VVHALNSESINLEFIELTNFSCSVTENVSHFRVRQLRFQV